ncbi:DEAD/DEAH box helicase [Paenibacillus sabinae]|uniref:AAA ATPase n=1 Tax=Paenibacillus sabinae T27 TaxID=1268072 RepID=X4ZV22_9BACL|nr:AAA domain-containing protein [Paenibacillus sabinae]AHV95634.1 AAA ATPase [Paenibacillus sabinae T27]
MELRNLRSGTDLELWVVPADKQMKPAAGFVTIDPSDLPDEYRLVQDGKAIPVALRDKHQQAELDHHIKRGSARIAHIVNTGRDGSALLRIHFFQGPVIEMGAIDIALDDRILAAASRHGFRCSSVVDLAKTLQERIVIRTGESERDRYFLLLAGAAADDDFQSTEDQVHAERWFSICADGFRIPTEKRAIRKGEEVFFANRFVGAKLDADRALRLVRGEIRFSDKAERITALAAGEMSRIIQQKGSYLKKWDEYAAYEGEILLAKARAVGKIAYAGFNSVDRGIKFFVDEVPNKLSMDDKLEVTDEIPVYLKDPDMEWQEYSMHLEQEFKGESQPSEKEEVVTADIIEIGAKSITLATDAIPEKPTGFLLLSIQGDKAQIKRKLKARKLILEGRSANPLLGLLIEEDGELPDTQRVTKHKPLTPFVKDKIFKHPPTPRQSEAIDIALNTPDIALIQGPPGTGKTTVITAIIERLNEIHDKSRSVRGQILVSAFQHDAVENMTSRLSVNSLPPVKYGRRSGEEESSSDLVSDRIAIWCSEITSKIREKNPQIAELEEQRRLNASFRLYTHSPSDRNAMDLLKQMLALPRSLMPTELLDQASELFDQLEDENRLQGADSDILPLVRSLRVTDAGFRDDGPWRASDLYMRVEEELDEDERHALKLAVTWKPGRELAFLDPLKRLKQRLVERYAPRPSYKIEKPRADVLELFGKVAEQLAQSRNAKDTKDGILVNFLHELENNPVGVRRAIEDYNFVYASTVQGAEGKAIKRVKLGAGEENVVFDSVIIDEAARTSPPDLLIPMTQAEKRIILVGDHRQLPHIINDDIVSKLDAELPDESIASDNELLRVSMFEYLFNRLKKLEQMDGISRTVTLDAQYRMHPMLGEFVSDMFYKPYNEAFRSPLEEKYFQHELAGMNGRPLGWIDIQSREEAEVNAGTSWRRTIEAHRIAEKLNEWIHSEQGKNLSFGVITFYKAQVDCLFEELHKYGLAERVDRKWQIAAPYRFLKDEQGQDTAHERLRIGTVDAFQGMEFDVVFLSMVRTNRQNRQQGTGRNLSAIFGRLLSENLLCVSMSRQKRLLIAAGDSGLVMHELAGQAVPSLAAFYQLCTKSGVIL